MNDLKFNQLNKDNIFFFQFEEDVFEFFIKKNKITNSFLPYKNILYYANVQNLSCFYNSLVTIFYIEYKCPISNYEITIDTVNPNSSSFFINPYLRNLSGIIIKICVIHENKELLMVQTENKQWIIVEGDLFIDDFYFFIMKKLSINILYFFDKSTIQENFYQSIPIYFKEKLSNLVFTTPYLTIFLNNGWLGIGRENHVQFGSFLIPLKQKTIDKHNYFVLENKSWENTNKESWKFISFQDFIQFSKNVEEYQNEKIEEDLRLSQAMLGKFLGVYERDCLVAALAIEKIGITHAYISYVGVSKEHRKKGFGNQIVNQAINFCQSLDVYPILIVSNPNIIQLYLKNGFKIIDSFSE